MLSQELMDVIAIKIGEMSLAGVGIHEQAKRLSTEFDLTLNHSHITRYKKRAACQNYMAEATQEIRRHAVADLVRRVSKLVPLIEDTIMSNLEDGNINAVPHALKIIGLGEEEKSSGQQSLTVVMPGASVPNEKPALEIEKDDEER